MSLHTTPTKCAGVVRVRVHGHVRAIGCRMLVLYVLTKVMAGDELVSVLAAPLLLPLASSLQHSV